MRIVFDVTPLSVPPTGIGKYLAGTLHGLASSGGGHELVGVALAGRRGLRQVEETLADVPVDLRFFAFRGENVWRRAWGAARRPSLERFIGAFDVLHVSDWWRPPQRAGLRTMSLHDLVPLRFPEWTTWRIRAAHRLGYRHAVRSCDTVFTNSRYTKNDAVRTLGIPDGRVRVAYPGVDPSFAPSGEGPDLPTPYLLTVATLEPRKNLGTLLEAHRLLGGETPLVVAGGAGWGRQPELDRPGVTVLGYVAEHELPKLYRGAAAFVYPSRFEGFGMPIVEAMASGVPVVASAHGSMDEACGDAAVRADPDRAEDIAAGIERALADRERLVPKGLAQARRFTWEGTARAFLDGFREAVDA